MNKLRALLTFGTRPEAIKMAPVVHECRRHGRPDRNDRLRRPASTAQMLDQVTEYFGIEVDRDLDLMAPNQTLADVTARCLTGPRRRVGRVPARLRRGPGRHDHGHGGRAGRVLPPRAVGPRRGRPAHRQPSGPLARGTQPPHRQPGHRAALRRPSRAAENLLREGIAVRKRSRDRQHGDRRPAVDRGPRARARPPLAREIRRDRRPPHGARSPAIAARTSATAWSRCARRFSSWPGVFPTSSSSIRCI